MLVSMSEARRISTGLREMPIERLTILKETLEATIKLADFSTADCILLDAVKFELAKREGGTNG